VVISQCDHKFSNDEKCKTPHLYENDIKKDFIEKINRLIENKAEILDGLKEIVEKLTDTKELDRDSSKLQDEVEVVTELST
jgi:hypothetical protein